MGIGYFGLNSRNVCTGCFEFGGFGLESGDDVVEFVSVLGLSFDDCFGDFGSFLLEFEFDFFFALFEFCLDLLSFFFNIAFYFLTFFLNVGSDLLAFELDSFFCLDLVLGSVGSGWFMVSKH